MNSALLNSRMMIFVSSLLYAVALSYCLSSYASVEWASYGYSFKQLNAVDVACLLCVLGIWATRVPKAIIAPSSLILVVTYAVVCIPSLVVALGLNRDHQYYYYTLIVFLTFSFLICCQLVSLFSQATPVISRKHSQLFVPSVLVGWTICFALLIGTYRGTMSFVSLDNLYAQREIGAATSLFMGYVQTYYGYVFSPVLLVIGLTERRLLLVVAGIVGGLLLYSITAEKTVFLLPGLIILGHYFLSRDTIFFRSTAMLTGMLGAVVAASVFWYEQSAVAAFMAWYLGVRTLLTPGLFVSQYLDFFGETGYTFLSHVSGIGSIVPRPAVYQSESRWPSIGHIVGEQYVGFPDLNANASFLASDGIASFGVPGVLFAFLLLAVFLIVLDRAARGIDNIFCVLVLLPVAFLLTNGSLFTVSLSFGGGFWILAFYLFFSRQMTTVSRPLAGSH